MLKVVLLGAPGVGKGTYGKLLGKELNLKLLTVGDLVRNEISKNTDVGKQMKQYSLKGQLVPDDVIISLVSKEIKEDIDQFAKYKKIGGIVFDGFPRTISQAKALDEIMTIDAVININMQDQHLIRKLLGRRMCADKSCGKNFNVEHVKCDKTEVDMPPLLPAHGKHDTCDCGKELIRRADDVEHVVKNRLEIYKTETLPLVEYYKNKGVLRTIEIKKGLKDFPKILSLL